MRLIENRLRTLGRGIEAGVVRTTIGYALLFKPIRAAANPILRSTCSLSLCSRYTCFSPHAVIDSELSKPYGRE
jgi:hypothetical protein